MRQIRRSLPPTPNPRVVPAVQRWTGGAGALSVLNNIAIRVAAHDAVVLDAVAGLMRDDLIALGFRNVQVQHGESTIAGEIILAIDPTIAARNRLASQAYQLDANDSVRIVAPTRDGIFFGTRTLLQMLKIGDGRLPRGTVLDYPDYARRMLMIDVAHKPFPMWMLKDFIRSCRFIS